MELTTRTLPTQRHIARWLLTTPLQTDVNELRVERHQPLLEKAYVLYATGTTGSSSAQPKYGR